MRIARPTVILLSLLALSGCGAIGALSDASAELDAYTLSPVTGSDDLGAQGGHLVVELPTSAGALATDRILIKPLPYQAQYLPDGRWTEPAPALLQTLLVASFQTLGGFRLVARTGAGLMPDYTLMTELQAFQAEPAGPELVVVRISMLMTLIRESDRSIVASRRFTATSEAVPDATGPIVSGFDSALQTVLREAVVWTAAQAG